ncbi:MAG: hypothetical protein IT437_09360 [Phycisphaerales bacterium]|nr:hypothetical protein [Phycisphaerales bacterium]
MEHPKTAVRGVRKFDRAQRVAALLCIVVLLSVTDLYMTLTHLRGIGMLESNPVARLIMRYNSSAVVVSWKCATVLLAVLILFFYRRTRQAEVGAWAAALLLGLLTVHWVRYNDEVAQIDPDDAASAAASDPRWVNITDDH